jgi:hypothetical protein
MYSVHETSVHTMERYSVGKAFCCVLHAQSISIGAFQIGEALNHCLSLPRLPFTGG